LGGGVLSTFLERVAARLQLRGPRFTDADLGAAIPSRIDGINPIGSIGNALA
jgi:hypothetical protein